MMQSNLSGGSGFVKQISVSMTGAVVFKKNLPSRNWHSSVLSCTLEGKQAVCSLIGIFGPL